MTRPLGLLWGVGKQKSAPRGVRLIGALLRKSRGGYREPERCSSATASQ
ncbi:hypothetical protein HMPREF0293_0040 [Corynebacterium glucuronolyticum ATCC 51866]|uniref:Uncharacterized protein n=1 Tax=Corynebacterium glucuronolyticum ATCC 51866 TaxID=548478 RepID=A0ABP2E167_9CORY|nr:hypothetical protein HMPREF0293_0040 [Corynebacterium glucuronolyticum ATCC 51866]